MKALFELELLGGAAERRYRRDNPGIDELPWHSLDPRDHPPALVEAARAAWTQGAFSEYTTAAAFSELLRALLEARAPIDLVGMAGRFVADEMVHTELNARMAMQLGGAVPYRVDYAALTPPASLRAPRLRALELAVRYCCVGEALSLPLLAGSERAATHPLTRAVLARIVRDEAGHAQLGWLCLEWADGWLRDDERRALGRVASEALARYARERQIRRNDHAPAALGALGWMEPAAYAALCADSMRTAVIDPLARYGVDCALP